MICPFCYQEKHKLPDRKEICLHIEGAPRTHGFSDKGPYAGDGARGYSLVTYLILYFDLSLEEYRRIVDEVVS